MFIQEDYLGNYGSLECQHIIEYFDLRDRHHLLLKIVESREGCYAVVRIYPGVANSNPARRRLRKRIQKWEYRYRFNGYSDCQNEYIYPQGACVLLVKRDKPIGW